MNVWLQRLCVLACIISGCVSPHATDSVDATLRVMTFNIRYGTARDGENAWPKRHDFVFDFLRRERPDVIGWQETLRGQLDELHVAMSEFVELGVGRDDGKSAGEYAAIFYRKSRLYAERSGTFWFSNTPEVAGSNTWERRDMRRICTWARLRDLRIGGSFWLFNVHLDDQSQVSREKSVNLLLQRIATRGDDDPVLVTGDFNAGETNPAIVRMKQAGWLDAHRAVHSREPEEELATFHGFRGITTGLKIDYVFLQPGMRVIDARIHRDSKGSLYLSDHYPVSAEIRLRQDL